jgi:hypothetical protein
MAEFMSALGVLLAVGIAIWMVGSIALRLTGLVVVLGGVVALISGSAWGLLALAVGFVAWLSGHWLFAFRHHGYRSPFAQRLFRQVLPARLDATRRWVR